VSERVGLTLRDPMMRSEKRSMAGCVRVPQSWQGDLCVKEGKTHSVSVYLCIRGTRSAMRSYAYEEWRWRGRYGGVVRTCCGASRAFGVSKRGWLLTSIYLYLRIVGCHILC